MTVVAIKCQHCLGKGYVEDTDDGVRVSGIYDCEVCDGTGTERPPQDEDTRAVPLEGKPTPEIIAWAEASLEADDEDTRARQAVEGKDANDENV